MASSDITETSILGIFAAGDVRDTSTKQVVGAPPVKAAQQPWRSENT